METYKVPRKGIGFERVRGAEGINPGQIPGIRDSWCAVENAEIEIFKKGEGKQMMKLDVSRSCKLPASGRPTVKKSVRGDLERGSSRKREDTCSIHRFVRNLDRVSLGCGEQQRGSSSAGIKR